MLKIDCQKIEFTQRLTNSHKLNWTRYCRMTYKLVHNIEDSKDIVSDAYRKALKAWDSFDPDRDFENWFYKILERTTLDFLKSERKRKSHFKLQDETTIDTYNSNKITVSDSAIVRLVYNSLKTVDGMSANEILVLFRQYFGENRVNICKDLGIGYERLQYLNRICRLAAMMAIRDIDYGKDVSSNSYREIFNNIVHGKRLFVI
ncbi:MAG: sigma-70 family RNA polymerase sigma factor [Candidatus Zixiibacteriota bacterium]